MKILDTIVIKFGGTSVADVSKIKNVAQIISEYRLKNPGTGVAVVVSAMAGETNKLIALAKSCAATPNPREYDTLLASGEQVTTSLLAMALIDLNIEARSFLASQAQIRTDQKHTNAKITGIEATKVQEFVSTGGIAVVAGFQGVTAYGDLTTLGRGGSDITAVALASALKAKTCFIYTDVPGVFSSDPRIVPNAKLLKQICHEDMLEMASLGAKVLHTRSVYFAKSFGVPLVVLSTFHGECFAGKNGTWIVNEEELMEKLLVTGVTYKLDEAQITVDGVPDSIGEVATLFEALGSNDIPVDMITQTQSKDSTRTLSFTVPDESSGAALKILRDEIPKIGANGAHVVRDIAKVSLVGVGMRYHTDVAGRLFRVLAKNNISVELVSSTETKLSLLVPRKYCELAVKAMHLEFIENVE